MSTLSPQIAYYSPSLQGSLSMAVLQRECGGTFVTNRSTTLKRFQKLYPDVTTMRRYRYFKWMGGCKLLNHADVIFSGAAYGDFLPQFSAQKCMVFHGTFGCLSERVMKAMIHFDHLFLIGPRMEQCLLRFNDKYNFNYSVTGFVPFALYPKKTEKIRLEILEKLGLNLDKKTVVYTPSKASVGTWLHCAEDIAKQAPLDFNLVLRPHPNQALNGNNLDKASFKRILRITKDRPDCLIDLSICSLPELECVADLIISDCNSPAEESLFYDCAQLFADTNQSSPASFRERFKIEQLHREDIEDYLQLFDCGPSRYGGGFNEWGTAIRYAIEDKSKYTEAREKCFTNIFGEKDRFAAKRVAESLKTIIPLDF